MWHLNVNLQGMLLYRTAPRICKKASLSTGIDLRESATLRSPFSCVYNKIIYEKWKEIMEDLRSAVPEGQLFLCEFWKRCSKGYCILENEGENTYDRWMRLLPAGGGGTNLLIWWRSVACWGQVPRYCRRTSRLVWPLDYYPFLLFSVGISDVARGNHWRGWWRAGSPDGVSSVLPRRGKGLSRIAIMQQVNTCLSGWCHREGFGFCNLGTLFEKQGLLSRYGMHPTNRVVNVLANSLANLILVLHVKEFLEYVGFCLGTNDEPGRELVTRCQRTYKHRWQCIKYLFQISQTRKRSRWDPLQAAWESLQASLSP